MKIKLILFTIFSLSSQIFVDCQKICASEANLDACQQLARNFTFACNYYLQNVDCLLGIESNQSHVGRITGEQALLGANLLSDDVIVLGEITTSLPILQTVVLVKNSIPDGFTNLKSKKFCHPGFKYDNQISQLMLKEFEIEIMKLDTELCFEKNRTLVEKYISSLSRFFGNSCRPGLWSQNTTFDKTLKKQYDSLCNLCGENKCDISYINPLRDSLWCLTQNDADIAITSLQEAQRFFSSSSNKNKYKYLCRDGSSTSSEKNCIWSSQLRDLIVAERSMADKVKSYLLENMSPSKVHNNIGVGVAPLSISNGGMEQALVKILNLDKYEKISLLSDPPKSLKEYVQEYRNIPTFESSKLCDETMKWCTYRDQDQQKCNWLSQAAINWGIQPVVECKRSDGFDELSCLDDIKKETADITVSSSDYAYISLSKGLKNIAYPETDLRFLSVVLVVVRANNTSIKTFKDLKGKQACIPRFGGKEHLAFIDILRKTNIVDDANCDYGNLLSDFVSSSCIPGVRSNLIKETTLYADKDKLCSLCRSVNVTSTASYCNADALNKYFGNEGALKCLDDSVADFAVISKTDVDSNDNYKVLCKNNTFSSKPGLQVDDECGLDVIATSEVVSKSDNPKNQDIILALQEFEKWFGQNLDKPFHLFDSFNGTLDLLFRDSTPGLSFSANLPYMKSYQQLLERAKDCKDMNGSLMITSSLFTLIVSFVILFIN